jgi:hypothetical protein
MGWMSDDGRGGGGMHMPVVPAPLIGVGWMLGFLFGMLFGQMMAKKRMMAMKHMGMGMGPCMSGMGGYGGMMPYKKMMMGPHHHHGSGGPCWAMHQAEGPGGDGEGEQRPEGGG